MTIERNNIAHLMWRKKVDNSLFRHEGTAVPRWVASMWQLEKYFPDNNGFLSKRDKKLLRGGFIPFPPDEILIFNNSENIKQKLKNIIYNSSQ